MDEALAIAASAPEPGPWAPASGIARTAASRLADLFTEDELLDGLRLLQAPSGDPAAGVARSRAIVIIELAIVLHRAELRISGGTDAHLRMIS